MLDLSVLLVLFLELFSIEMYWADRAWRDGRVMLCVFVRAGALVVMVTPLAMFVRRNKGLCYPSVVRLKIGAIAAVLALYWFLPMAGLIVTLFEG